MPRLGGLSSYEGPLRKKQGSFYKKKECIPFGGRFDSLDVVLVTKWGRGAGEGRQKKDYRKRHKHPQGGRVSP